MSSERRQGTCLLCRKDISLHKTEAHLRHCLEESFWPMRDASSLLILAQSVRHPQYWMVLLLRCNAEIFDLESLIRDIWFESGSDEAYCRIKTSSYFTHPDVNQLDMYHQIHDQVQPGDQITYGYGKWSADTVHMTVLGEIEVAPQNSMASVLARNNPPAEKCMICGNDALYGVDNSRVLGGPHYICTTCILTNARGMRETNIQPLYNSPRMTFCYESKNLRSALCWYPPGYGTEDLYPLKESFILSLVLNIPTDTNNIQDVSALEKIVEEKSNRAIRELSDALCDFAHEEYCRYGRITAIRSTMIIVSIIITIYTCSSRNYQDWDAKSVADCLEEGLAGLNFIHPSWREEIVPTFLRFVAHLERKDNIRNAGAICNLISDRERRIINQFEDGRIDRRIFAEFKDAIVKEFGCIFDESGSCGRFIHSMSPECRVGLDTLHTVQRQIDMAIIVMEGDLNLVFDDDNLFPVIVIKTKCSAFSRHVLHYPDDEITENCNIIIESIAKHPEKPLTRGNPDLWAAAIIYLACIKCGFTGFTGNKKDVRESIAEFYERKPGSIQSKVSAIKRYL